MNNRANIVIAGAGTIGRAVASTLRETPAGLTPNVYIGDRTLDIAAEAAEWINGGSAKSGLIEPFAINSNGYDPVLEKIVRGADVVLDCLPGEEAPKMARIALNGGSAYANLTEHVQETEQIMKLAADADTGFILQTGLAPGFVNVLAMDLFKRFCEEYGVKKADSICMRVGALTEKAEPPHFYGYTWSKIGVANEYVHPARVIINGGVQQVPSLSQMSEVTINGRVFQDDFTSGGTADLPEALVGKVDNLHYRTLRHPGHYNWVDALLTGIKARMPRSLSWEGKNRLLARELEREMSRVLPSDFVEDDMVVVHVSVAGRNSGGQPREMKQEYTIFPQTIGGKRLRAIQATTAAGLAESARLLLTGEYKGVVTQSMINPREFMSGPYVSQVFGNRS
ncbi:saccharopine dehydrogenase NADP-binding domain-containing protein [Candidatus Woesearchaeota archaeon]|nr:saccharopine dehydrogenase NADP-binding domain-containing protein [Candidatus Woesearchaeota archaeon]